MYFRSQIKLWQYVMSRNHWILSIIIAALPAVSGCLDKELEGVSVGGIDLNASSVVALSPSLTADGSLGTIEVTVVNVLGYQVPGTSVSLVSNRGASDTITALSSVTDAQGVARFTTASTSAGRSTYTAVIESVNRAISVTADVVFTAGPISALKSTILVNPSSISLTANETAEIRLTALDAYENPITTGGETVVFTRTFNSGESEGTIYPNPARDNGDGTYSATYTPTKSGTTNYIGFDINGASGDFATIDVTP